MLKRNIMIAWIVTLLVVFMFVTLAVAVPGLINMHNDGALIFALVLTFVALTVPFVVYATVIKPLLSNQEL